MEAALNKSVLFVYTGGRANRIEAISKSEAPSEFFYGYPFFRQKGVSTEFIETDLCKRHRLSPKYWKLSRKSNSFIREFGIGSRAHLLLDFLDKVNQYDVVLGTTDSIGLGLCYLKKLGDIRSEIVFLNMGLGGGIAARNEGSVTKTSRLQREIISLLGYSDKIVSLGKPEHGYLLTIAPHLKSKLVFLPFGVDTDFWRPSESGETVEKRTVLSVGNDRNRDWQTALDVASICPDVSFKFVTQRLSERQCPRNVELIYGDLKKRPISEMVIRDLYRESRLVMIPLKQTLQPSGQSVTLQALACGTPVIISETPGFWDSSRFINGETIDFVDPENPESFKVQIERKFSNPLDAAKMGENGSVLVNRYYSAEDFSNRLKTICNL